MNETPEEPTPDVRPAGLGGLGYKPARVRLRALTLDNFKSFANKVKIELREGFTAVSGPNGSGKSNLVDALLFVLGFASSKGMRADRLTDLINTESGKPEARVALELEVVTTDGETKTLEVSRAVRRIRGGESQAHYELDGAVIKLGELHEILKDLDLASGGLNVVGQNDVTRVTALGEVSRRHILDELSGAQELDQKIGGANRELGEADVRRAEVKIVLSEIETRLAALEKEKEQALAYQALTVDKERLESDLVVLDVLEAQERARKKGGEVKAHRDRVVELKEELVQAEADSAAAKESLDAVEAEIAKKGEGERLKALQEIEALKANLEHARSRAAAARAEVAAIEAKATERQSVLEGAEGRERSLGEREESLKRTIEQKIAEHTTLRREVGLAALEIQKRARGTVDAVQLQRACHEEASQLRAREADLQSKARGLRETAARDGAERALLVQALESDRARKTELERKAAEAASARRMAREDLAREEERLRKLIQRAQQLRSGLEKTDHDASAANSELGRLDERRKAALDNSGGRGLEVIRFAGLAGVRGPLHELIKFDVDHALAIEAAAGARLSWVVVDDERVGQRAIELLKRANGGRLTFTPLTKIRPPRVDLTPVKGRGVIGYALELVKCDQAYAPVVRLVFSDTLVVESMQAAIELGIGRYRIVTVDGDLLDRTGTMSGGSASRGGTILAMAARLEKEIAQKQAALDEILRRQTAARTELAAVESEGQGAQGAFASRQTKLAEATAQCDHLNAELVRLEERIAPAESRLKQLDASLGALEAQLAALEGELAAIRDALVKAEERLRDLSATGPDAFETLTTKTSALEEKLRELQTMKEELVQQLTNVQVERRGALGEVEAARRTIEEARCAVEATLARAAVADAEATKLEKEVNSKQRAVAALLEELQQLVAKRDEAKAHAQDMRDGAKEVARLLEAEEKATVAAEQAFAELDAQARSLLGLALDRKLSLPALVAPDAKEAPEGALRADELGKLRETTRRDLAKTEGKMKALEPVNMLAITQHAEFESRRAELAERIGTLDREMEALRSRIVELDGAKRSVFLQSFEAVSKAFSANFTELMGGGEGWLTLRNPEDPFAGGLTIHARPRGLKAARLEALSGGEKTLTAIAFLFALQEVNPAPFFVYDEVDAALDGANTGMLASAIRRRSSQRQYFVVSHRRALVEKAHHAIGVTKRKGVGTMVVGITLDEVSAVEASIEAAKRAATAERRPDQRPEK